MLKVLLVDESEKLKHEAVNNRRLDIIIPESELDILEYLKKTKIHYLIIPYKMKILDSLQLVKDIRKTNEILRIIIVMSINNAQTCLEYLNYGANEILIKPVTLEKILAKIDEIIDKKIQ